MNMKHMLITTVLSILSLNVAHAEVDVDVYHSLQGVIRGEDPDGKGAMGFAEDVGAYKTPHGHEEVCRGVGEFTIGYLAGNYIATGSLIKALNAVPPVIAKEARWKPVIAWIVKNRDVMKTGLEGLREDNLSVDALWLMRTQLNEDCVRYTH